MSEATQTLSPAATVIVVRDGEAPDGRTQIETLMLKRNERGSFGGMWVFPGGKVDDGDADPSAPDDELAAARRAAAREAHEEAALVLDPAAMVPLSHWRPPVSVPRGFTTWFFVAAGSSADVEVDGAEIHEHAWLTPGEVLRRHRAGDVTLAAPTFVTLTLLGRHDTVDGLLEELRAATPERFYTQLGNDGESNTAMWHGDDTYDAKPGPAGARHRLTMAEGGWRYERSPLDDHAAG